MGNTPSIDITSDFFTKPIFHRANETEKNCGIRYSGIYLNQVESQIPTMTMNNVADLVDYITWSNAGNEAWVRNALAMPVKSDSIDSWNATSFGNAAHLSFHAPTEELKTLAKKQYNLMIKLKYPGCGG